MQPILIHVRKYYFNNNKKERIFTQVLTYFKHYKVKPNVVHEKCLHVAIKCKEYSQHFETPCQEVQLKKDESFNLHQEGQ